MKVAVLLAKNILTSLRITAATSAIDVGIQKKIHGSGSTTLVISNEQIRYSRSKFARKFIIRKRSCRSWFWK